MSTRNIHASTTLCAVVGHPVAHSLSPAIHNAAFTTLGLDYAYVAFDVTDVPGALGGVRALGIRGLSVTIPHKVTVYETLGRERLDTSALDAGAVNTVVNERGALRGYNTDGWGAHRALVRAGVELRDRPCVVVGTGGAARAVALYLARHASPANLSLVGRNAAMRRSLADAVRALGTVPVAEGDLSRPSLEQTLAPGAVIVQTTPVGMHPDVERSPIPAACLRADHAVFDIVYTPARTRLLRDAEAAGARTVRGLEMFLWQAARQFELWTGREAPVDVMRAVATAALGGVAS